MGMCGCGDNVEDRLLLLPNGWVIAHGTYRGCEECHPGPGYGIKIFDSVEHARRWIDVELEAAKPDEFGGNDGGGFGGGLFEVCDLAEAARYIERGGSTVGESGDQYASVADFMEDFGLAIVQDAMELSRKRLRKPSAPAPTFSGNALEATMNGQRCIRKPSAPAKREG